MKTGIHTALLIMALPVTAAAQDIVFQAMADELQRSRTQLVIAEMAPPHYLSYRVQDVDLVMIEARYGALVQTESRQNRYLYIDLRVGSPQLDNSGFISSWRDIYNQRHRLPVADDYRSLRHHLWLHTDAAYKAALENLARKRAYLQAHPVKEEVPDQVPATCVALEHSAAMRLAVDTAAWEREVAAAARVLRRFPGLQDWKVSFSAAASNKRYLNSEAGRHLKGAVHRYVEVAATAQAPDGQRLSHSLRFTARGSDQPPTGDELQNAVRDMAAELEAMVAAPPLDEYAGPVLFSGFAAAQLISQLFISQLGPPRAPLAAEEWMNDYLPEAKLAGRVNRRIMPRFMAVVDDPTLDRWRGRHCAGTQLVDDEGVRSEKLTLVKEGRLVALPLDRRPTKKLRESTGRARTLPNQWTLPAVTNLIVSSDSPERDLVGELRRQCREFGSEYGLLITHLADPQVVQSYRWTEAGSQDQELLAAPVIMYKVYADDGRREAVRGLVFDEVSIRALRDIVALGSEAALVNLRQPSGFEGLSYPIAVITPDILFEELEFREGSVREPLPLSANPIFGR